MIKMQPPANYGICAESERVLHCRSHVEGLAPVRRTNSRLKFDFVRKPELNIASVTLSPRRRIVFAVSILAALT